MNSFAIFVGCFFWDFFQAKILCESIRYFCGNIPIVLVKDGNFDASQLKQLGNICEFERAWVPAVLRDLHGFGLPKLGTLFQNQYARFLYLDADTVLLNDILQLPFEQSDFYVDTSQTALAREPEWVKQFAFDSARIAAFDADFQLDDLTLFNSGQWFGRTGLIDLDVVLECVRHWRAQDGLFALADQGILNYLFNRGKQRGECTLEGEPFKIGGGIEKPHAYPQLTRENVLARAYRERAVIHWAGVHEWDVRRFEFGFVLDEFQRRYYRRFPSSVYWQDRFTLTMHRTLRSLRQFGRGLLGRE